MLGMRKRIDFKLTKALVTRFWNCTEQSPGCWKWTGTDRGNGYGCLKTQGRMLSAHVLSWVIHNNQMPPSDKVVAHKCDNRNCVNPDHLELISSGQNLRDANERLGRNYRRGEEIETSVLTEDVVREIRKLQEEGYGYVRIARLVRHKISTVKGVCYGRTWRHVK